MYYGEKTNQDMMIIFYIGQISFTSPDLIFASYHFFLTKYENSHGQLKTVHVVLTTLSHFCNLIGPCLKCLLNNVLPKCFFLNFRNTLALIYINLNENFLNQFFEWIAKLHSIKCLWFPQSNNFLELSMAKMRQMIPKLTKSSGDLPKMESFI